MARKQEGPGDGAAPDLSKHKFALFCSPSGEGLRTLAGWEAPGTFSKGFEVIGRESSFQTLPGNVPGLPLGLSKVVSEETTRSGHRGLRVPCFLVFTLLYFLFFNIFFPSSHCGGAACARAARMPPARSSFGHGAFTTGTEAAKVLRTQPG